MAQQVGEIYYNCTIETKDAIDGMRRVEKQTDATAFALKNLSTIAGAVAGAFAVNKIVAYADAWTLVNNRMANATKAGESQADVTERVFQIAQRSRGALSETAALYQRLEFATRKYVDSGYDAGQITETISKAIKVSGAGAQESAGAMQQLGQALGSGVLRGQEFNSMAEQAPVFLKYFADQLGVGTDKMRQMAEAGEITTPVMLKAFAAMKAPVDDSFAKLAATWAENIQVAENSLTKFIGSSSTVKSVVSGVSGAFVTASENLDAFIDVAGAVASLMVGKYAVALYTATSAQYAKIASTLAAIKAEQAASAQALAKAQADNVAAQAALNHARASVGLMAGVASVATAEAAATTAATALAAAQTRAATASAAASVGMRGLSAALALLGGPVGILITVGTALAFFSMRSREAKAAALDLSGGIEGLTEKYKKLSKVQAEAELVRVQTTQRELTEAIKDQADELQRLEKVEAAANKTNAADVQLKAANAVKLKRAELENLQAELKGTIALENQLKAVASGGPIQKAAVSSDEYLTQFDERKKKIAEVMAWQKAELEKNAVAEGISEQTRADAAVLIRKQAADKIAAINKKASGGSGGDFNFKEYYAGLTESSASAWDKVAIRQEKAMADLDQKLKQGKVSYTQYEQAKTAISQNAESERLQLIADADSELAAFYEKEAARAEETEIRKRNAIATTQAQTAEALRNAEAARAIDGKASLEAITTQLNAEAEAKITKKREELQAIGGLEDEFNAFRDAVNAERDAKILAATKARNDAMVASYASMAGSMSDIFGGIASAMSAAGKENSRTYKAMFAVSKAFSIAQAGLNFSLALSNALASAPWPANMAAMAQVAATAAPLVSQIASAAYGGGRRYGGPTEANTMYQVNESGVPEMWTANNGKQYMMTGSSSGSVTAANKIDSGVQITINNNAAGVDVTATASDDGKIVTIAVNKAIAEINRMAANNTGSFHGAMQTGYQIKGRTS